MAHCHDNPSLYEDVDEEEEEEEEEGDSEDEEYEKKGTCHLTNSSGKSRNSGWGGG